MVLLGLGTVQSKLRQRQPSWKPLGLTHGRGQKVGGCVRERERGGYVYYMGFSGGSAGKGSTCNVGGLGLIPGLGRSPGGGHGNPLQYSCLENPQWTEELLGLQSMGVTKSWT